MLFDFANVLVFVIVGAVFVFAILFMSKMLRPSAPSAEKLTPYECGERPVGSAWFNFNLRFYTVALIFIVFDVEIVFLYPVATVFRRWVEEGRGVFAIVEIFLFLAILLVGFAFVWGRGDLNWVKLVRREREPGA